jgi:hypothetical protein
MKVIADLGVNFRYLLHLKCELWLYKPLVPGEQYVIDYIFEDVIRIKKDKAAIVGHTAISRSGELYLKMRDYFVIKHVQEKYISHLKPDETNQFKGITRLPAEPLDEGKQIEIYIPPDLAKRYGETSGDRNMLHTSARVARLFGYDRPFIQGLCSANMVMKELVMAGITLDNFSITFCLPVFLDSRVFLNFNDQKFRLQDDEGKTLCFGCFNSPE